MDEPASALDPLATTKIEDLILELKKELHHRDRDPQHAAGRRVSDFTAFFYVGELIEFDDTTTTFQQPEGKEDGGLHHRTIWLSA